MSSTGDKGEGDRTYDDSSRGAQPPGNAEPVGEPEPPQEGQPPATSAPPNEGEPAIANGQADDGEPPLTGDTVKVSRVVVRRGPPPLEPGFILDRRYEIEKCIGEGGSGFVFSAFDRSLGVRIALKTLRADRANDMSWIKRMRREVKVARAIEHANVCRVFDFNSADGYWFITMDLAPGGSLRDVLDKRSGLVRARDLVSDPLLPDKLGDARAVCAGLSAIHAVGIVHRDVTPGNVLRMADGRLVITDFGLAVRPEEVTTFHGGTPRYMAPEVIAKQPADQRSDVWQLGILLHEILFGRYPRWDHDGDRVSLRLPADDDSEPIERELAQLCSECLSHNPDARPANAMVVGARLTLAERAKPLGAIAKLWRRARQVARRPIVWGVILTIALVFPAIKLGRALLRPSLCDRMIARADTAWSARHQDLAETRFASVVGRRPRAYETFKLVTDSLKKHLGNWGTAYRTACIAADAGQRPSATLACLEDDLDRVRGLVSFFENGRDGENLVDGAPYAIASLRDVGRCGNASPVSTAPRPPPGTHLREQVDELRRELMFANPLMEGEHFATSADLIEPLVEAAKKTNYYPLIAEALLAEAHAAGRRWDSNPAYRSRLEDALWQAEWCGHDRIVAIAAGELAFADRFKPDAISSSWARMADSVLGRMGGDVAIQSWLENSRALAANSRGRFDQAVEAYEKALTLKRSEVGPEHLEYAIRLLNLSDALKGAGRLDEALTASDQALTLMIRWLGPDHIDIGYAKSNRGDLLVALNRVKEAEAAYANALAIFKTRLPAEDSRLTYPLAGMGVALLKEGKIGDAREILEEAAKRNVGDDRFFAGDIKFALARALSADEAERGRAITLARDALETYAEATAFEERRKEIAEWIASQEHARATKSATVRRSGRRTD